MTLSADQPEARHPTWQQVAARLQPRREVVSEEELEHFEVALQRTIRPVEPPGAFRDGLRRNLEIAAQRREMGLQVDIDRSYTRGILVGTAVGISALLLGTFLWMLLRPNAGRDES